MPNNKNNGVHAARDECSSPSNPSPKKTESVDGFTGSPPKLLQRPVSSKSFGSDDSNDSISPLMNRLRKSLTGCLHPDGHNVIDPKKSGPLLEKNGEGKDIAERQDNSLSSDCEANAVEIKPEVRVLTPTSLKSVPGDIIRLSKEIEEEFVRPKDLTFEVVGKPFALTTPRTEEEQKVYEAALEKQKEINLVQSNVADALGGRAWELVAEESASMGDKDDEIVPETMSDNPTPSLVGLPSRLAKLDIEAERQKLGEKGMEKLRKAEEKRQKLLEKKRTSIKDKLGEKEQQLEKKRDDEKIEKEQKMIDLETKHLKAAMNREEVIRDRKVKLAEATVKQDKVADDKLVEDFMISEEKAEEATRLKEANDRINKDKEKGRGLSGEQLPNEIDLDPEIEALMAEYNIGAPTPTARPTQELASNQQSPMTSPRKHNAMTSPEMEALMDDISSNLPEEMTSNQSDLVTDLSQQKLLTSTDKKEKNCVDRMKTFMNTKFKKQGNKVTPL